MKLFMFIGVAVAASSLDVMESEAETLMQLSASSITNMEVTSRADTIESLGKTITSEHGGDGPEDDDNIEDEFDMLDGGKHPGVDPSVEEVAKSLGDKIKALEAGCQSLVQSNETTQGHYNCYGRRRRNTGCQEVGRCYGGNNCCSDGTSTSMCDANRCRWCRGLR